MTLTDILPMVHQLTPAEKLKLIRALAEDLDTRSNIGLFEAGKVYDLPTPYNCYGAAQLLAEALANEKGG